MNTAARRRSPGRGTMWIALAAAIGIMLAGHAGLLYFASQHIVRFAAAALFCLVLVKHLGFFAAIPSLLRRFLRKR